MKDANSLQDARVDSDSYRQILPKYNSNKQYLKRNGFNQLQIDMGFTQIRLYCFKKKRGRVFHIMTNNNALGANVVKFFTNSNTMPEACGSFTRLPDNNSTLANSCANWGYPNKNEWGHDGYRTNNRLYRRPMLWVHKRYFSLLDSPNMCDDDKNEFGMSLGDTWKIFVR